MLKSQTWLHDYVAYTQNHEAPEVFHVWTGLSTLGAALGRRVHLHRGYYNIFPGQLMVCLVAGAAVVRKSTAAKIAIDILEQSKVTTIITGKSSPEAFIDSLMLGTHSVNGTVKPKDSAVMVFSSELSSFLSKQAYTEALLPILTDLADAPDKWPFKTRGKGIINLQNVCLSFLAASTPDWLADAIPVNAFGGGFMSRIIFIYADNTPRRNAFPVRTQAEIVLQGRLIQGLIDAAQLTGEMMIEDAARKWFIGWYGTHMDDLAKKGGPLAAYYGRRPDHMLRVGMILSASRGDGKMLLLEDLHVADALMLDIEKAMPDAFAQIGTTPAGRDQELIMSELRKLGGAATEAELLAGLWHKFSVDQLRQAIMTLSAASLIEQIGSGNNVMIKLLKP